MRVAKSEDGAAATIVVVFLSFGMVLGLGAVVLDYGAVYAERRQLQNGAEAAVLALARDCAADESGCDTSEAAAAPWVAYNNSTSDGVGSVFDVCRAAAGVTGPCASFPGAGALTECLPPNSGAQADWSGFIEVRSETDDIPALMGQVFGPDTKSAGACARAAWGPVGSLEAVFPVTFSKCEYEYFMAAAGGVLSPSPAYDATNPRPSSDEVSVVLKSDPDESNAPGVCPTSPPGGDRPGGFGYIDTDGDCTADIDSGGYVGADPGSSAPNHCDDRIIAALESVIYFPVYDDVQGTGSTAEYHISGFAGFYLSGYRLQSGIPPDDGDIHSTCTPPPSGETRCLFGWFVGGIPPGSTIGGGGIDYGVRAVQLTG